MQIKLSKAKSLLEQYIHSEGRHWKSKVRELVDDAFLAYDGRLDYLKLTWDDYGLDTWPFSYKTNWIINLGWTRLVFLIV